MMARATYVIYGQDELPVLVGYVDEVARFLKTTSNNVQSTESRQRRGMRKATRDGYQIVKVEI